MLSDAYRTALESYARAVLHLHGLDDWQFVWLRSRKRRLGACWHNKKRIGLSAPIAAVNGWEMARETILHEVAHAIAGPGAGHGPAWKATAARVGCKRLSCHAERGTIAKPA